MWGGDSYKSFDLIISGFFAFYSVNIPGISWRIGVLLSCSGDFINGNLLCSSLREWGALASTAVITGVVLIVNCMTKHVDPVALGKEVNKNLKHWFLVLTGFSTESDPLDRWKKLNSLCRSWHCWTRSGKAGIFIWLSF